MSETAKTRELVLPYVQGNGIDLGSGGDPIVPWAIQFDLHRHHKPPEPPVQFVDTVFAQLPFRDSTLSFVYASHVLEDTFDWLPVLREWARVLKPGGFLVIQVPDKLRFRAAVAAGRNEDNLAHQHESRPGELSELLTIIGGFSIIRDGFYPANDYNILFCAVKQPCL